MKYDQKEYYVIFDTNTLFQSYDKKADFTLFSFNSTYQNVVDMINQLDIYNNVRLVIPSVVWQEMKKQIIDNHDEQLERFKMAISKRSFPEFTISKNDKIDYPTYINSKIDEYKTIISSGINTVIEIPVATSQRFGSIVDRAFNKNPPFEGKDKKSDKGFKDALLWESILEFASIHPNSNIIYYSKDNAFGDFLSDEFKETHTQSNLFICKDETSVKKQLELWAKEIDKYSYYPIEDYNENKEITEWLNTEDFLKQIIDPDFGIVEKSHLIFDAIINLISIDSIELIGENNDESEYSVDVVLKIVYIFKDGNNTSETVNANLRINRFDETNFSVQDLYRIEDLENESEAHL